jgi:uncharacterized protein YgbK (DUF1537 family)
MIAVIADDFTGAAEIGGLGLLYGLKTAIVTQVEAIQNMDLLVIATEMRSLDPEEAAKESERLTKELLELNPEFIYKKIDSVLRGNICVEIKAQMKISNKTKALVIPANPILRRTIKDGIYYIDDKPLMVSKFADDLVYKAKSSNVLEIIGKTKDLPVVSVSHKQELPDKGILVGDTINMLDLNKWAKMINGGLLPAGGAGFFNAILKKKNEIKKSFYDIPIDENKKALYICGSNFPLSKQSVLDAQENGHVVSCMPNEIYYDSSFDPKLIDQWSEEIINEYQFNNRIIISVLQKPGLNSIRGKQIKNILGILVKRILDKIAIDELLIEGGSTAHIIVKELNMDTFYPIQSLAPGVTKMRVGNNKNLFLTIKPGSYIWPKSIWEFN